MEERSPTSGFSHSQAFKSLWVSALTDSPSHFMRIRLLIHFITLSSMITLAGTARGAVRASKADAATAETARLEQMTARFAPTEITADMSKLSPTTGKVLAKLVEASKIIDACFCARSGRATTRCCSIWRATDA